MGGCDVVLFGQVGIAGGVTGWRWLGPGGSVGGLLAGLGLIGRLGLLRGDGSGWGCLIEWAGLREVGGLGDGWVCWFTLGAGQEVCK